MWKPTFLFLYKIIHRRLSTFNSGYIFYKDSSKDHHQLECHFYFTFPHLSSLNLIHLCRKAIKLAKCISRVSYLQQNLAALALPSSELLLILPIQRDTTGVTMNNERVQQHNMFLIIIFNPWFLQIFLSSLHIRRSPLLTPPPLKLFKLSLPLLREIERDACDDEDNDDDDGDDFASRRRRWWCARIC